MLTDIHCHILPGLDDGPQETDQSIRMAMGLKELGFSHIVATPHIKEDKWPNRPEVIGARAARLQEEIDALGLGITILTGAEHHLDSSFRQRVLTHRVLPMGDSKNLLIELPHSMISGLDRIFFLIQTRGYSIVLAHPERYPWITPSEHKLLKEMGIRYQVSLCSLGGKFGRAIRRRAVKLISGGLMDVLATDVHSPSDIDRWLKPGLQRSEKLLGPGMKNLYLAKEPRRLLKHQETHLTGQGD